MKICILVALMFFAFSNVSTAANIFIDPSTTVSDGSRNGSSTAPWKTFEELQDDPVYLVQDAANTIYVRGGTVLYFTEACNGYDSEDTIYFDWTGQGTERNPSNKAYLFGSEYFTSGWAETATSGVYTRAFTDLDTSNGGSILNQTVFDDIDEVATREFTIPILPSGVWVVPQKLPRQRLP